MTALYLAATIVCIAAAFVFIGAQIIISWRQFMLQSKQNSAFKETQEQLHIEIAEIRNAMNEINQHLKSKDNEQ